ncbi:MAG: zinc ribbon domain-containing protein [Dehalococcoidia bacterium]
MPLYAYKCEGCGNEFEEVRRVESRDDSIQCTTCQEKAYRRLTTAAIHGFEYYKDPRAAV